MKSKAQMGEMGVVLMVFISVLVGLILFQVIAQTVGDASTTTVADNITYTAVPIGEIIELAGQEYIDGIIVTNATINAAQFVYPSTNYSIGECVGASSGVKSVCLTVLDNDIENATSINVSYNYGPDGYIDSSGGRAMASLIAIFFALAIVVIVMLPVVKNNFMGK